MIENKTDHSFIDQTSKYIFSKMSTANKLATCASSAFLLLSGACLLVAGVKSLGMGTITLAGMIVAASPVGACIAGGVLVVAALVLNVRMACSIDKETYIKDRTHNDKCLHEQTKHEIENLKNKYKVLEPATLDAAKAFITCVKKSKDIVNDPLVIQAKNRKKEAEKKSINCRQELAKAKNILQASLLNYKNSLDRAEAEYDGKGTLKVFESTE